MLVAHVQEQVGCMEEDMNEQYRLILLTASIRLLQDASAV